MHECFFILFFSMAFRASFLRIFSTFSTRKTGAILLGVGGSAIGIGTAFGFSFVTAREKPKVVDLSKFMAEPLTAPDTLENSMDDMKSRMEVMILGVQADICRRLAAIDGQEFQVDRWVREEGGGGITCVLQNGKNPLGMTRAIACLFPAFPQFMRFSEGVMKVISDWATASASFENFLGGW